MGFVSIQMASLQYFFFIPLSGKNFFLFTKSMYMYHFQEAEMEALEKEEALLAGIEDPTKDAGEKGSVLGEEVEMVTKLEGYLDGELDDTFDMSG